MIEQFAEEITTSTSENMEEVEGKADDEILKKRNQNSEHFELEFCDIFNRAITKLLDLDDGSNILYLRRFFRIFYEVVTSWCKIKELDQRDKDFKHLLTCSLYYRVAYMYRLGVALSSATAFHFKNVLIENPNISKLLLNTRNLKISSLGNGSPAGLIGVAKVLEAIAQIMNIDLEIFATIIDADGGWKNASITALTGLEQFHKSTWKINFIEADISKKISENVVKVIQGSDIVTLVNVNPKNKIGAILKNITVAIRPGSMLFVLDSSRLPFIKSCGGQTGAIDNLHLIYEELCQNYVLQASSVKKLFVFYHKYFPTYGCDRKLDVFARAWVKPSDKITGHLNNMCLTNNRENQNSLTTNNYYHNWDVRFSQEMAKYGWDRKGTNKVISIHRENRSRLMKRHFETKKLVSFNRGKLTDKLVQDTEEFSQSENEEDEWEDLYEAKRNLARVQTGVTKMSVFNLRCSLKRNIQGPPKKGKLVNKKPIRAITSAVLNACAKSKK